MLILDGVLLVLDGGFFLNLEEFKLVVFFIFILVVCIYNELFFMVEFLFIFRFLFSSIVRLYLDLMYEIEMLG